MKNLLLIAAASAALVACQKETIVQGGNDPAPVDVSNVVLPPSITATKTYRCKDNSVVYIDWLTDGTARVKTKQTDVGTSIKVGADGTPSLKGDAKAATITYNGESCKA
jgi:hypothetical protein